MQNQLNGIIRNKAIYQKVAPALAGCGYSCTWQQCQVKVKNLVLTCISCKLSYAFSAYKPIASQKNIIFAVFSVSSAQSRPHAYMYNLSGIQFTLQNDSADAIEADWKWIQTGSVNSH